MVWTCGQGDVGLARWLLYEGGPGGFAPTPMDWALPPGYGNPEYPESPPFDSVWSFPWCAEGRPASDLIDMNQDGVLDLVVTGSPCGDGDLGRTRWLVHEAIPGGFAPPIDWVLPSGYGSPDWPDDPPFGESAVLEHCPALRPAASLRDLTADGRQDLVVTDEPCAMSDVGFTMWLVYDAYCEQ